MPFRRTRAATAVVLLVAVSVPAAVAAAGRATGPDARHSETGLVAYSGQPDGPSATLVSRGVRDVASSPRLLGPRPLVVAVAAVVAAASLAGVRRQGRRRSPPQATPWWPSPPGRSPPTLASSRA